MPLRGAVRIARGGEARARIVVAAEASETERFAADELALFLHIVTGARFPVVTEPGQSGGRMLVGPGAARLAAPKIDLAGLGPEEIMILSAGADLVLAGGGSSQSQVGSPG